MVHDQRESGDVRSGGLAVGLGVESQFEHPERVLLERRAGLDGGQEHQCETHALRHRQRPCRRVDRLRGALNHPRLIVAAFVVAAPALLTGCGGGDAATSGPLAASLPGPAGYSVPLDPGQLNTVGLSLLNPSNTPMTLDSATPVGERGPHEIIATAILHHPSFIVYGHAGYPPQDVGAKPHPVAGWVVKPHENDDNLVFGLRIKSGVWLMPKIRLIYHAGKKKYVDTLPYSIETCAPRSKWPKSCPAIKPQYR